MASKKSGAPATQIEVRVLVDATLADGTRLSCNSVATLDPAIAAALAAAGVIDLDPEAVKAAKAE